MISQARIRSSGHLRSVTERLSNNRYPSASFLEQAKLPDGGPEIVKAEIFQLQVA